MVCGIILDGYMLQDLVKSIPYLQPQTEEANQTIKRSNDQTIKRSNGDANDRGSFVDFVFHDVNLRKQLVASDLHRPCLLYMYGDKHGNKVLR